MKEAIRIRLSTFLTLVNNGNICLRTGVPTPPTVALLVILYANAVNKILWAISWLTIFGSVIVKKGMFLDADCLKVVLVDVEVEFP